MKRYTTIAAAAALLFYSLFILLKYSENYQGLAPFGFFASFIVMAVGVKLLFILALVLASFGVGGAVFSRLLPGFGSLLEEALIKAGLGLVALSLATFAIGLAGLLYPVTGYIILACGIAAGGKDILRFLGRLSAVPRSFELNLLSVLLCSLAAYILIRGFYQSLLPPTAFDVLMYHFGVPKMYIDAHRIFPTPDINGSSYPFGTEMLYMLAMLTESDISANLINYFFAVGSALLIYGFSRRFMGTRHNALAPVIFLSVPVVVWLLPQAYIEFSQCFFICLSVYALIAWLTGDGERWSLLSAVFVGMAMCIKYTSNFSLIIMAIGVSYKVFFIDRRGASKTALAVIKYSIVALLVVSPWYLKNVVYYGNPVYPMFSSSFTGVSEEKQYWAEGMKVGPLDLLKTPWRVTMEPEKYKVGQVNSLGPFFLMFIPGIILYFRKAGRAVRYAACFCCLYAAAWFFTAQNIRYTVPMAPFLALLAAYPVARLLESGDRLLEYAGSAMALLFSVSALFANTPGSDVFGFPTFSYGTRDGYYSGLSEKNGYLASYETWKWINDNLREDAVIYQLWDDASVYFRKRKTLGFPVGGPTGRDKLTNLKGFHVFDGFKPGEEIVGNLKEMGAQYLLINTNREGRSVPEDPYFQAHAKVLKVDKGVILYQLTD